MMAGTITHDVFRSGVVEHLRLDLAAGLVERGHGRLRGEQVGPVHQGEQRSLPGDEGHVHLVVPQQRLRVGLGARWLGHRDVEEGRQHRGRLRGLRAHHGRLEAGDVEVRRVAEDHQQQQRHHDQHAQGAPVTDEFPELLDDHGPHAQHDRNAQENKSTADEIWLGRLDLVNWWHDGLDTARRAVDAGGPVRVPLALPAGGGAGRDGRAAGGTRLRPRRRGRARPGLFRAGRVPRLVRQRPRVRSSSAATRPRPATCPANSRPAPGR